MTDREVAAVLEAVYREERLTLVATLARLVGGDLTLAEDAVHDAVAQAAVEWPARGVPDRPAAWLTVTARRRAVDRLRREATGRQKLALAARLDGRGDSGEDEALDHVDEADGETTVDDDRLRLIYTCCHPALAFDARVALTAKVVAGLTVPQVARALLTSEATMYQRIVRAKRKITAAGIPYRAPRADDLPARLAAVLRVVYVLYTEAHTPTGDAATHPELAVEALRLARLLAGLHPDEAEARGLLSLLLLTEARRPARFDAAGRLVALDDQDRTRWDQDLIDEGLAVLDGAVALDRPGPYQLQAAIAAVHDRSPTSADTDWVAITRFYAALERVDPGPVVRVNRAVAVGRADGPRAGLRLLESVGGGVLDRYGPYHAARAELCRQAGDVAGALDAYDRAIGSATSTAEAEALTRRRAELAPDRA